MRSSLCRGVRVYIRLDLCCRCRFTPLVSSPGKLSIGVLSLSFQFGEDSQLQAWNETEREAGGLPFLLPLSFLRLVVLLISLVAPDVALA